MTRVYFVIWIVYSAILLPCVRGQAAKNHKLSSNIYESAANYNTNQNVGAANLNTFIEQQANDVINNILVNLSKKYVTASVKRKSQLAVKTSKNKDMRWPNRPINVRRYDFKSVSKAGTYVDGEIRKRIAHKLKQATTTNFPWRVGTYKNNGLVNTERKNVNSEVASAQYSTVGVKPKSHIINNNVDSTRSRNVDQQKTQSSVLPNTSHATRWKIPAVKVRRVTKQIPVKNVPTERIPTLIKERNRVSDQFVPIEKYNSNNVRNGMIHDNANPTTHIGGSTRQNELVQTLNLIRNLPAISANRNVALLLDSRQLPQERSTIVQHTEKQPNDIASRNSYSTETFRKTDANSINAKDNTPHRTSVSNKNNVPRGPNVNTFRINHLVQNGAKRFRPTDPSAPGRGVGVYYPSNVSTDFNINTGSNTGTSIAGLIDHKVNDKRGEFVRTNNFQNVEPSAVNAVKTTSMGNLYTVNTAQQHRSTAYEDGKNVAVSHRSKETNPTLSTKGLATEQILANRNIIDATTVMQKARENIDILPEVQNTNSVKTTYDYITKLDATPASNTRVNTKPKNTNQVIIEPSEAVMRQTTEPTSSMQDQWKLIAAHLLARLSNLTSNNPSDYISLINNELSISSNIQLDNNQSQQVVTTQFIPTSADTNATIENIVTDKIINGAGPLISLTTEVPTTKMTTKLPTNPVSTNVPNEDFTTINNFKNMSTKLQENLLRTTNIHENVITEKPPTTVMQSSNDTAAEDTIPSVDNFGPNSYLGQMFPELAILTEANTTIHSNNTNDVNILRNPLHKIESTAMSPINANVHDTHSMHQNHASRIDAHVVSANEELPLTPLRTDVNTNPNSVNPELTQTILINEPVAVNNLIRASDGPRNVKPVNTNALSFITNQDSINIGPPVDSPQPVVNTNLENQQPNVNNKQSGIKQAILNNDVINPLLPDTQPMVGVNQPPYDANNRQGYVPETKPLDTHASRADVQTDALPIGVVKIDCNINHRADPYYPSVYWQKTNNHWARYTCIYPYIVWNQQFCRCQLAGFCADNAPVPGYTDLYSNNERGQWRTLQCPSPTQWSQDRCQCSRPETIGNGSTSAYQGSQCATLLDANFNNELIDSSTYNQTIVVIPGNAPQPISHGSVRLNGGHIDVPGLKSLDLQQPFDLRLEFAAENTQRPVTLLSNRCRRHIGPTLAVTYNGANNSYSLTYLIHSLSDSSILTCTDNSMRTQRTVLQVIADTHISMVINDVTCIHRTEIVGNVVNSDCTMTFGGEEAGTTASMAGDIYRITVRQRCV